MCALKKREIGQARFEATRRERLRAIVMLATMTLASCNALAANQGLEVELNVETADGKIPTGGQTVAITLSYKDTITGRGPKGLVPAAWIRRLEDDRLPCHDAAQNFRITRSVSRDDVPLFGAWIGLVHADGNFGLIDPKIDFQGTNLVAMKPLGGIPTSITATRGFPSLFASLPGEGSVKKLSLPDLTVSTKLKGVRKPGDVIEGDNGQIFVAEDESGDVLISNDEGRIERRLHVGSPPVKLSDIPASLRFSSSVFARSADGSALWLDRTTGETIHSYARSTFASAANATAWPGGLSVALDGEPGMRILYRDAPARQVNVALTSPPDGLASDRRGRYLLAWSNSARTAQLIEIAYGKVVQSFALELPISEVVFSGETLFVGYNGGARISIVDLAARRAGKEALVRGVVLESRQAQHIPSGSLPKILLEPIGDEGMATAIVENGNIIYVLHGGALHATPIVGTISAKGAAIRDLAILDRSLVEIADGTFKSNVRLPEKGPLELVATTGVGGLTSCLPIVLAKGDLPTDPPAPHLVRLDHQPVHARQEVYLRLRLANIGARAPEQISFVVMALGGGWLSELSGIRQSDGTYLAKAVFPAPGEYPLIVPGRIAGKELAPLLVEVGL